MKYLLFLLLPNLIFAKSIVVEDNLLQCSNRLPENIFESVKDLSKLHTVDNISSGERNKMKLLGITLLDMTQSKQRVSTSERPGSLTNIDLLIVLRPLPKKVELPRELLPRFIIQCSTFQEGEISSLKCDQISPERAFGINKFKMTMAIRKHPEADRSCPTQVGINYYVEIDDDHFKMIKEKSFDLLGTNAFIKLIANLFADPKLFFKTYWEGFYDHWVTSLD